MSKFARSARLELLIYYAIFIVSACSIVLALTYCMQFSTIVVTDQWRMVDRLQELSVFSFITEKHNGHRIAIYKIFFLFDYYVTNWSSYFSYMVGVTLLALYHLLLFYALPFESTRIKFIIVAISLAILSTPLNYRNYWDIGQFVSIASFLFFSLSAFLYSAKFVEKRTRANLLICCLSIVLAYNSFSYGISLLIIQPLALYLFTRDKRVLLLAAGLIVYIYFDLIAKTSIGLSADNNDVEFATLLLKFGVTIFSVLGVVFRNIVSPNYGEIGYYIIPFAGFVFAFSSLFFNFINWWRSGTSAIVLSGSFLMLSGFSALLIFIGRTINAELDTIVALSSAPRYFIVGYLLMTSTVIALYLFLSTTKKANLLVVNALTMCAIGVGSFGIAYAVFGKGDSYLKVHMAKVMAADMSLLGSKPYLTAPGYNKKHIHDARMRVAARLKSDKVKRGIFASNQARYIGTKTDKIPTTISELCSVSFVERTRFVNQKDFSPGYTEIYVSSPLLSPKFATSIIMLSDPTNVDILEVGITGVPSQKKYNQQYDREFWSALIYLKSNDKLVANDRAIYFKQNGEDVFCPIKLQNLP